MWIILVFNGESGDGIGKEDKDSGRYFGQNLATLSSESRQREITARIVTILKTQHVKIKTISLTSILSGINDTHIYYPCL